MKFKAQPNYPVRIASKIIQRATGLRSFTFDANGEYETDNPTLIKVLSQQLDMTISEEPKAETRSCKKCNFTCETQGQLLQHYKKSHPKGVK